LLGFGPLREVPAGHHHVRPQPGRDAQEGLAHLGQVGRSEMEVRNVQDGQHGGFPSVRYRRAWNTDRTSACQAGSRSVIRVASRLVTSTPSRATRSAQTDQPANTKTTAMNINSHDVLARRVW